MLIPALEALTIEQEAEIERLCVEEIAQWRARPGMKKLNSLRPDVTDTRNRIKQIELNSANSYFNPRTEKQEHIALKYLNLTGEEWHEINLVSEEKLQERRENQQLIEHPDAIVARAEKLLA